MNEKDLADINASLTLPLMEGEQPFALTDQEEKFGPDDWAWIFLRMNQDYRKAYAKQKGNANSISAHLIVSQVRKSATNSLNDWTDTDYEVLESPSLPNIKVDRTGACGKRFGLGAWLNPEQQFLPPLDFNGSWFFPMKRPFFPDRYRVEFGVTRRPASSLEIDHENALPRLLAMETPFGYCMREQFPYFWDEINDIDEGSRNCISVAIDCSIPPNGQLSALKALAHVWRKYLIDIHGAQVRSSADSNGINFPDKTIQLLNLHIKSKKSAGGAKNAGQITDQSAFWRIIQIDALGALGNQIENLTRPLTEVYKNLMRGGQITPPPHDRFDMNLPSARDKDGTFRHGGSYLKALLAIAELTARGITPNEIAKITGTSPSGSRYANDWRMHFHNNIEEKYISDAAELINDGYRRLIHAQKPDSHGPSMQYLDFVVSPDQSESW